MYPSTLGAAEAMERQRHLRSDAAARTGRHLRPRRKLTFVRNPRRSSGELQ